MGDGALSVRRLRFRAVIVRWIRSCPDNYGRLDIASGDAMEAEMLCEVEADDRTRLMQALLVCICALQGGFDKL